ncbi:MAG TPA: hypothetical protein VMI94_21570 [Bryobacteraceae bacterium]|nr:hypothetical protein [Bryobacteraceae bacterium]
MQIDRQGLQDVGTGLDVVSFVEMTRVEDLPAARIAHRQFQPGAHDVERPGRETVAGFPVGQHRLQPQAAAACGGGRRVDLQRHDRPPRPCRFDLRRYPVAVQPVGDALDLAGGVRRAQGLGHKLVGGGEEMIAMPAAETGSQVVRIGQVPGRRFQVVHVALLAVEPFSRIVRRVPLRVLPVVVLGLDLYRTLRLQNHVVLLVARRAGFGLSNRRQVIVAAVLRRIRANQEVIDLPRQRRGRAIVEIPGRHPEHIASNAALVGTLDGVTDHAGIAFAIAGGPCAQGRVLAAGQQRYRIVTGAAFLGDAGSVQLRDHAAHGLKELVFRRPAMGIHAPLPVDRGVTTGRAARFRIRQRRRGQGLSAPRGGVAGRERVPLGAMHRWELRL